MRVDILAHLRRLVAFDTRNPPRAMDRGGLFSYLGEVLGGHGFAVEIWDHGGGCVSLLGTRGAAPLLFNFHVDTVPAAEGWSSPPLELVVDGARARGLGACDTKGAAAAMLAAVARSEAPAHLLFTSDEEAGEDRCVGEFLELGRPYAGVIVAEPTANRAVLAHRGIASVVGTFHGTAGHASSPRALVDSALHGAIRWGARALEFAAAEEGRTIGGLPGIRFNLGVLQGGRKSNMIAERAELRYGVRPRPGEDLPGLVARLSALAGDGARAEWRIAFAGPPLPPQGAAPEAGLHLADWLELPVGPPVDFWSEASLFAAAGYPSLVLGPGEIAQAHATDEWVALDQLDEAAARYGRLLAAPPPPWAPSTPKSRQRS